MAEERNNYRPFPGNAALYWPKLWQGPDHVLLQARFNFVEQYRRFFFRDIQAVIIRRTPGAAIRTTWISILLGFLVVLNLITGGHAGVLAASGALVLMLVVNLALGPTCRCHLKTATYLQPLYSLKRMNRAMAFVEALRPLVDDAQGTLTDEEIRRRAGDPDLTDAPPVRHPSSFAGAGQPAGWKAYHGSAHGVLFVILAAGAAVGCIELAAWHVLWASLAGVLLVAQLAFAVAAAARQADSSIPGGLRMTVWLSIVHVCMVYLLMVTGGIYLSLLDAEALDAFFRPGRLQFARSVFSTICSAFLAVSGFVQLGAFRRRLAQVARARAGMVEIEEG